MPTFTFRLLDTLSFSNDQLILLKVALLGTKPSQQNDERRLLLRGWICCPPARLIYCISDTITVQGPRQTMCRPANAPFLQKSSLKLTYEASSMTGKLLSNLHQRKAFCSNSSCACLYLRQACPKPWRAQMRTPKTFLPGTGTWSPEGSLY